MGFVYERVVQKDFVVHCEPQKLDERVKQLVFEQQLALDNDKDWKKKNHEYASNVWYSGLYTIKQMLPDTARPLLYVFSIILHTKGIYDATEHYERLR